MSRCLRLDIQLLHQGLDVEELIRFACTLEEECEFSPITVHLLIILLQHWLILTLEHPSSRWITRGNW